MPPDHDAAYVAAMEDILDVYALPYDPLWPVICMDEQSKQLLYSIRKGKGSKNNKPAKTDNEYGRNGTANVFIFAEPLAGWRHVHATRRRTKLDWAHQLKELADVHYPEAERIRLIMDNLNTHRVASLYEAFPPAEARRLARRFEMHYTPKHGSWLNIAEIELSALTTQCLARRIPNMKTLERELAAWEAPRNAAKTTINWRFTISDARRKMAKTYPNV